MKVIKINCVCSRLVDDKTEHVIDVNRSSSINGSNGSNGSSSRRNS